jgi:hypothetical protein
MKGLLDKLGLRLGSPYGLVSKGKGKDFKTIDVTR